MNSKPLDGDVLLFSACSLYVSVLWFFCFVHFDVPIQTLNCNQSIYIEISVRNKCRCSFYCALDTRATGCITQKLRLLNCNF
jgi:hypothetical protein